MMRLLSILLVLTILSSSARARAADAADAADAAEKQAATPTIWPAHVTGILGGLALGTAIAFASLKMNADHSARVAEATIAGAGANPGACNADVVRADLGQMCSLLARHEAASDSHGEAFTVALGVGLSSLAFAFAWYVITK